MPEPAARAEPAADSRFDAGPIRRFTADMIDDWLFSRLNAVWPGHPNSYWMGRFLGFMQSNDYLCVCNNRAVLLAERKPHPMSGAAEVSVIFNWSRDTVIGDWCEPKRAGPMIDLYIYCRNWMSNMVGAYMVCGSCDDLRGDQIVRLWVQPRHTDGFPLVKIMPSTRASK